MTDACFYVICQTVQDRILNVGTREVYFNRAGHSAALTEAEFNRLLTIPGFTAADGPPHVELAVDASGTAPCPVCMGRGRVAAAVAIAAAQGTLEFDFETAPQDALPAEGEAPEEAEVTAEDIAWPPPITAPEPFFLSDEEIASWQETNMAPRIAFVEETNLDADQLNRLFNAEGAGKNSKRVLEAIERKRDAVKDTRGAVEVNAGLLAANAPATDEE